MYTHLYEIISCGWENSGGCHEIETHVALWDETVKRWGGDGAAYVFLKSVCDVFINSIADGKDEP